MRLWERYKAAIFDLDGTLADSMGVWDNVCRDWMRARGLHPPDDLEETLSLMTLDQSAAWVRRHFLPALGEERIRQEWSDVVAERYAHVALKPGALELLRLLRRHGMPLALATSCFPRACERLLRRQGLREAFSAVVYTDEAGRDKTYPDIYRLCARRLGVTPAVCVVFEDLYGALQGVRAAGMEMVAVRDASCHDWQSLRAGARWAVESLTELLDGELANTGTGDP